MRQKLLLVSFFATLVLLSGCAGSHPFAASPIAVSVSPSGTQTPPTIQQGQTVSITATVSNDPANQGITWTVSCAVSACGSVSPTSTASGVPTVYTAPSSVSASLAVTVTATSVGDPSKTASIMVTVTPPTIVVTLSPSTPQTVSPGATLQITATVANDPAAKGVTWTATCSPSPCGSFNPTATPSGTPTTYTAPTPVTATLAATVTATSVSDPTKSASLAVTVVPITVTLSPSTPQTVAQGQTLSITATVANDRANGGVNWTATCSATACGTLNPTSTASGTPTTYTPPAPVTANLTVTVTATSVTDNTKSASLTVTVTPNHNAALSGDFAIQFTGFDLAGEVAVVGRFTADGNGGLSNGLLDLNTPTGSAMTMFTGTYTVGADNRGTLTANLATPPGGTLTARFVLETTGSETRIGRIIEFDDTNGMGTRGSGEIHKQDLTAAAFSVFNGDFALGFFGDFGSTIGRLGVVGRFTLATTSGATSPLSAGQVDASVPASSFSSPLTGQLNAPDAATGRGTGAVTITVPSPPLPSLPPPGPTSLLMNIGYYVVGANRVFVVVTDQRSAASPLLSGEVDRQQQATFDLGSLTGSIVFGVAGTCVTPTSSSPAQASVTIGLLQANAGVLSGMFDQNDCGLINSNVPITAGAYNVDSAVKGRVTITMVTSVNTKPSVLYLRDINKGFLLEGTAAQTSSEATFGTISPQVAPAAGFTEASLAGTYGVGTVEPSTSDVPNQSGVVTLTSGSPSTFSGTLDISQATTPFLIPGATFAGTYAITSVPGRFAATATSISPTPARFVIYATAPGAFGMIDVTPGNAASSILFFEQ